MFAGPKDRVDDGRSSHDGSESDGAVRVTIERPDADDSRWCLEQYFEELARRIDDAFDTRLVTQVSVSEMTPPSGYFFVARTDGRPVGCCALVRQNDIGEVKRTWTVNSMRRRGVAKAMLAALEAVAFANGISSLRLVTNGKLSECLGLYQKLGFTQVAPFDQEYYADHWFRKNLRESNAASLESAKMNGTESNRQTSEWTDRLEPEFLRSFFVGIDTLYPTADGGTRTRAYLDSAATGLALGPAYDVMKSFLAHYSNTHTTAHFAAGISTESFHWARDRILNFLGAPAEEYMLAFVGAGTTAAVNRFAERMARARPKRQQVLVSLMEHHSNDLPHRRFGNVRHLPLEGCDPSLGQLSLDGLERALREGGPNVRYVAVCGASNVTGILNPVHAVAERAHLYNVPVLVDGAQMAGHVPVRLTSEQGHSIDAFAFSGHKLYAPMSPGVLVARRELLESVGPFELGGGAVSEVSTSAYELSEELSEREHAGTPNIVGAVLLATVLDFLDRIGMDRIAEHGSHLVEHAWHALERIPGVRLYGSPDLTGVPRSPVVAFNLASVPHGVTAAILNDYFGIAVRNACFCAHPYVRVLLRRELWKLEADTADVQDEAALVDSHRGMVRASFGCYTTIADVDRLVEAVAAIAARPDHYARNYRHLGGGRFEHTTFRSSAAGLFDLPTALATAWKAVSQAMSAQKAAPAETARIEHNRQTGGIPEARA